MMLRNISTFALVKRIPAILLLLSFSCGFSGVLVLFRLQQIRIRREVKSRIERGIPDSALQVILLHPANAAEFEWQGADEFGYRGDRFDIVRKEVLSDTSTLYYCVNDRQESRLLASLHVLVKNKSDRNTPAGRAAVKLHGFYYLLPIQAPKSEALPGLARPAPVWHYADHYISPTIRIIFPPPRLSAAA